MVREAWGSLSKFFHHKGVSTQVCHRSCILVPVEHGLSSHINDPCSIYAATVGTCKYKYKARNKFLEEPEHVRYTSGCCAHRALS